MSNDNDVRTLWGVDCLMTRQDGLNTEVSHLVSWKRDCSEDEAVGVAMRDAIRACHGWAVADVVAMNIPDKYSPDELWVVGCLLSKPDGQARGIELRRASHILTWVRGGPLDLVLDACREKALKTNPGCDVLDVKASGVPRLELTGPQDIDF